MLEYQNAGIPECQNARMPERWKARIKAKSRNSGGLIEVGATTFLVKGFVCSHKKGQLAIKGEQLRQQGLSHL